MLLNKIAVPKKINLRSVFKQPKQVCFSFYTLGISMYIGSRVSYVESPYKLWITNNHIGTIGILEVGGNCLILCGLFGSHPQILWVSSHFIWIKCILTASIQTSLIKRSVSQTFLYFSNFQLRCVLWSKL